MDHSIIIPEPDIDCRLIIADSLIKLSSHIYNVLIRRINILYPTPMGIIHMWPRPIHKRISVLLYRAMRKSHALTFKIHIITNELILESLIDVSMGVTRAPKRPPDPTHQIETVLQNVIMCGIYQFFTICIKKLSQQVEQCLREGILFTSFTVIAVAGGKHVFPIQTTMLASERRYAAATTKHPSRGEILFSRSLVFYDPRISISFLLHWC